MVSVAIKAARSVCEVFISFSYDVLSTLHWFSSFVRRRNCSVSGSRRPRLARGTEDGNRHFTRRPNLMAAGSDDERSQGGRHVPNDAPTVPSSVLDQDIAGRQHHLRAIVEFECHVAGENDPEIRRVCPLKAVVSSAVVVAMLEAHLGS